MESWQMSLIAYLSLKAENASKISSGMVSQRIQNIRFAMNMIGVPSVSFGVKMLDDLPPDAINPNNLVAISTSSGDRLASLEPRDPRSDAGACLVRPPGQIEYIGTRRTLSCHSGEDLALLTRCIGKVVSSGSAVVKAEDVPVRMASDVRPVVAGLQAKLQVLQKSSMKVLTLFRTDVWESSKESTFTKVVSDLQNLKQRAEDSADTVLYQDVRTWFDGMVVVKRFTNHWSEHQKMRKGASRQAKMLEFAPYLMDVCTFLRDVARVVLAPSFMLLVHRAKFAMAWSEHSTLEKAAVAVVGDNALLDTFEALHKQEIAATSVARTSLDVWL